ncbi:hypothetical protein T4B_11074 [Trichinella pseudospiralis]|uniref:Uncharacterized protein n=1 Tax=Trichinella pseudospiralis TaxID=6337 RepID=A0A0V1JA22_TRIPS|nr:hypothetical protein T4B_11074 [Trichinella pseudospiralis]
MPDIDAVSLSSVDTLQKQSICFRGVISGRHALRRYGARLFDAADGHCPFVLEANFGAHIDCKKTTTEHTRATHKLGLKELAESLSICLFNVQASKQAAVVVFQCRRRRRCCLCVSALALDHESVRPAICFVCLRGIDPLESRFSSLLLVSVVVGSIDDVQLLRKSLAENHRQAPAEC